MRDVSLDVGPGEIVCVIGPNGAGKTTMLEAIVGLRRRDAGVVSVGARTLTSFRDHAAVFSFMPDEVTPPVEASVETLVAHTVRCAQRAGSASWDELLDALDLRRQRGVRAGELSRGERKRLALFGALCTHRPLVVLDEPLGAFDPLQLRDILAVLRRRASAGTSLLLSVHQMTEAERVADRVVLLAQGRTIAAGSREELRQSLDAPAATLEELFIRALERASDAAP
ncbi:MAG TPA: ABC transporter ATP-binding protein [Polyangiaceae bacterium]